MAPRYGDTVRRNFLLLVLVVFLLDACVGTIKYDRTDLLRILHTKNCEYTPDIVEIPDIIPSEIHMLDPGPLHYSTPPNNTRRRKRGRRAGTLVRYRRRVSRPPLPAILLSNVRSINNKTDEFLFLMSTKREFRDCSAVCLNETWLALLLPTLPSLLTAFRATELTDHPNCRTNNEVEASVCFSTTGGAPTLISFLNLVPTIPKLLSSTVDLSTRPENSPPLC